MQLKEAIIDCVIEDEPDFDQAIALLGIAGTNRQLFQQSVMRKDALHLEMIIAHFGELLRNDAVPVREALQLSPAPKPVPVVHASPTVNKVERMSVPIAEPEEVYEYAEEIAAVAMELSKLYKLRSERANTKHNLTTDAQRAKLWEELNGIQDRIVFKKKVIAQLKKGEKVTATTTPQLEIEVLPDNPIELLNMQKNLRTYRSRYAKYIKTYPEGHPNHQRNKALYSTYSKKLDAVDAKLKEYV